MGVGVDAHELLRDCFDWLCGGYRAQYGVMTLSSAWLLLVDDNHVARAPAPRAARRVSRRARRGRPAPARHFLERRARIEVGHEAAIGLAGDAVLEHRHGGAAHRAVAAVVEDDGEDRQLVHVRHPVADHRVGEHVGAVAERRDHELLRRGELGAERRAKAPAETAGGREAVECVGLLARAMLLPQRIFVEDDRRRRRPPRRSRG